MKQNSQNTREVEYIIELILEKEIIQVEKEAECSTASRKLTFSAALQTTPLMKEELMNAKSNIGNRQVQEGMKVTYIPLIIKDGQKIVKINHDKVEEECGKWEKALIGCIV